MKKIDFHIHTSPACYEPKQFDFSVDVLEQYVHATKLDAIAITNHNHFDSVQFNEIKSKLINTCVFPGVEVDIEKGHLLVIAPDEELDELIESCSKLENIIKDENSSITFNEFSELFPNYKKMLLIPHYKKNPSLSEYTISKFGPHITAGEVSSPKKFLNSVKDSSSLTPVYFSDFRVEDDPNRKAFPNKCTYLDITNCSFSVIKAALADKKKVYLNKDKKSDVFEYSYDGSIASTKLNVIIGKRSSGKTYNLNRVWDTREQHYKNIYYIQQFSLTGNSEESKFNELRAKEKDSIIADYLEPLKQLTSKVLSVDIDERNNQIQNYLNSLIEYANSVELNDEYSRTTLFNEMLFNYQDSSDTKKVLKAVSVLLHTKDNRDLVDKYLSTESLEDLQKELLQRLYDCVLKRELRKEADKIIRSIKGKLKNKSAITPPIDISLFDIFHDLELIKQYNSITSSLKTDKIIHTDDAQRFSLIAKRRAFSGVKDIKDHVDPLPSLVDPFKKFYGKDMYRFVRELKNLNVGEDKIYRCIVAIDIELKNAEGKDLSGGERAEFNLIKEIQNASGYDILLIDEPEASFDNPFIKENIIGLIKELSEKMTIFVSTHNSTIGLSMHPNMIIYTDKDSGEFTTYHGEIGDKELVSSNGKTVLSYNKIIEVMEAGPDTYEERRMIYETIKN